MNPVGKAVKVALAFVLGAAVVLFGARAIAMDPAKQLEKDTKALEKNARKGADAAEKETKAKVAGPRKVELAVTEKGYEPSPIKLKKGEAVKLVVTRKTEKTCANEIILDEHNINVPLPLNKPVEIEFTPTKTGTLKYGCAMGKMIAGVFTVE